MFIKFLPSTSPKAPPIPKDFEHGGPILSLNTVVAIMPNEDDGVYDGTALVVLQKDGETRQFVTGNSFSDLQNFLREHRLLLEPKNNQ